MSPGLLARARWFYGASPFVHCGDWRVWLRLGEPVPEGLPDRRPLVRVRPHRLTIRGTSSLLRGSPGPP